MELHPPLEVLFLEGKAKAFIPKSKKLPPKE